MDMGIISALKTHYKNALSRDKNIHIEHGRPFKVDILDAMFHLKSSWNKISPETIQNCFQKANFFRSDFMVNASTQNEVGDIERYDDDLLQTCDSDTDLQAAEESLDLQNEESNDADYNQVCFTSGDALKAYECLKHFLVTNATDAQENLFNLKGMLLTGIENCKKQSRITDFFEKRAI